jgi:hypothetical protein
MAFSIYVDIGEPGCRLWPCSYSDFESIIGDGATRLNRVSCLGTGQTDQEPTIV